jgi:hypothetical protein
MSRNWSFCVIVPAFVEESQIGRVIETMPAHVNKIKEVVRVRHEGSEEANLPSQWQPHE